MSLGACADRTGSAINVASRRDNNNFATWRDLAIRTTPRTYDNTKALADGAALRILLRVNDCVAFWILLLPVFAAYISRTTHIVQHGRRTTRCKSSRVIPQEGTHPPKRMPVADESVYTAVASRASACKPTLSHRLKDHRLWRICIVRRVLSPFLSSLEPD